MEWSFVLRIYNALTIVHWKSTMNLSLLNAHEDFSIQNKRESRRRRKEAKREYRVKVNLLGLITTPCLEKYLPFKKRKKQCVYLKKCPWETVYV